MKGQRYDIQLHKTSITTNKLMTLFAPSTVSDTFWYTQGFIDLIDFSRAEEQINPCGK